MCFKRILRCLAGGLWDVTIVALIFAPWSFAPFPYNYIGGVITLFIALSLGGYENKTWEEKLKNALEKRDKHLFYYPAVCFSTEDPKVGHIVMWSIGDIWVNYEENRCFILVSENKRYWKLIGCKGYTQEEKKKMKDCDTKDWDLPKEWS